MTLVYEDLVRFPYALSDGAVDKQMPAKPAGQALVPPRLRDSAGVMPLLHDVGSATPRTREAALALAHGQEEDGDPVWLCALLDVEDGVTREHLAQLLTDRLILTLPGLGPCFFRFFDPKVLIQLQWLLSDGQMAWLMGPVRSWQYGIGGDWAVLNRPATEAPLSRSLSLALTPRQGYALRHMQVLNEVLSRLPSTSIAGRQAQGRAVLGHLEKAAAYGLQRLRDLQAYAWHGMTVHSRFDTHPLIQQRLQSLPDDADFPYRAATTDLRPEDYDRIRDDLGPEQAMTASSRTIV